MTSTAPAPGPSGRVVTPYDFRRPIQLSREHARILQVAFEGFARQATTAFTSSLRRVCQVALTATEQRTYAEYIDSLGSASYVLVFTAEPLAAPCILQMPLRAVMQCVDHMLGGPGGDDQPERPPTEIEAGAIAGLAGRLLEQMRYSLDGTIPMEPRVRSIEYSPQFVQAAAAADVVVVLSFELVVEESRTTLTVCLPFNEVLPHLVAAAAPDPLSEREQRLRARSGTQLLHRFQEIPVDVAVRFRTTHVTPSVLSDLAPGDVVRLAHPVNAPLTVSADDTAFAHATAGTQGARLAALIVGTPEEDR